MGSNYSGIDQFSANLTLQTDDDTPTAAVFRVPNERLLDNDVHLRARVVTLETSSADHESRVALVEGGVHVNRGRQVEIFDDFTMIVDNSAGSPSHILSDSGPWLAGLTNAVFSAAASTAQSALRIERDSGSASGAIYKTNVVMAQSNWRMRARVLVDTLTTNLEVGFVDVGSPSPGNGSGTAFTAYFAPGTSANWLLRTRNGVTGNSSNANTGVAVSASTYYLVELGHNGTAYYISINDGAQTVAGANIPHTSDAAFPVFRMSGSSASDGARIDFIHAYSAVERW